MRIQGILLYNITSDQYTLLTILELAYSTIDLYAIQKG
jgi:hypothetical protein